MRRALGLTVGLLADEDTQGKYWSDLMYRNSYYTVLLIDDNDGDKTPVRPTMSTIHD